MAEQAQLVADQALKEARRRGALRLFDQRFSLLYLGNNGVGETLDSAWEFSKLSVRPRISYTYLGQSGFKEGFKEADDQGEIRDSIDQTHHFAAYLSAGINNQALIADAHKLSDLLNPPDRALGNAAFRLGFWLRYDPARLLRVKREVLKRICN
jgi:hypothetical protein